MLILVGDDWTTFDKARTAKNAVIKMETDFLNQDYKSDTAKLELSQTKIELSQTRLFFFTVNVFSALIRSVHVC